MIAAGPLRLAALGHDSPSSRTLVEHVVPAMRIPAPPPTRPPVKRVPKRVWALIQADEEFIPTVDVVAPASHSIRTYAKLFRLLSLKADGLMLVCRAEAVNSSIGLLLRA